jgi:hypothetical protein
MLKIANQILDFSDDTDYAILKKFAKKNTNIKLANLEEVSALDDTDFAISVITKKASKLNKFPINNFDNTWLSNEYFEHTAYNLPQEAIKIAATMIKFACEKHNINPNPMVVKHASDAKDNLYFEQDVLKHTNVLENDFSKFAKVRDISENETYATYAMPDTEHVKTACEYLKTHEKSIPLEFRHKYASAIQKRASALGFSVKDPEIRKYASDGYNADIDAHLSLRRQLVEFKSPELLDGFNKLAAMKNTLTSTEFAQVLHQMDKKAGLTQYYNGYLTDPYQATFNRFVNPNYVKTASGKSITEDDLTKLVTAKYATIKNYFGKNVADSLKKEGMQIFESLPMDAKEVILGIADGTL